MKKLLLKAMLLCIMSNFCAGTALADDSHYKLDSASGTITDYVGPGGDVVIPETIMGITITTIGDSAFKDNQTLTSITMPDTITRIEGSAFRDCKNITKFNFSQNLTYIGGGNFNVCTGVTEWVLPDSLNSLEADLMFSSESATYIRLPANTVTGGRLAFTALSLTQVDIPDQFVGDLGLAFNVQFMQEVTIPGGVSGVISPILPSSTDPVTYERPEDGYVIKVYDNTPMHFYCIDNGLNFELLGEWSPSATSTPSVDTPSPSTPSTSAPSTGSSSSGSSSSVEEESNHMVTLAMIGGVTVVLCVGVVAIMMKKK